MALLRMPRFIRRYLRRHTNPIPEDKAREYKKLLSFAYTLVAWNIFGFIVYKFIKFHREHPQESAVPHKPWWEGNVLSLNTTDVKTYKLHGVRFVETSEPNVKDNEDISKDVNL